MADTNPWQVVTIDEFKRPSAPTVTRVHQRWQRVLRLFGRQDSEPEEEKTNDEELPDNNEFNRKPAVTALDHYFEEWLEKKETTVCFLLDPPFSGTDDIARDWAKQKKWKLVTPPDINEIMTVDIDSWWKKQHIEGKWLIDDLSRYLVRTAEGLSFIRVLLPHILRGDFGQGLVTCDSWMFEFIQRIWRSRLPRVYCFDAAGVELLKQAGIHASDNSLLKLAARVRGNLGVAKAVWLLEKNKDRKLPALPNDADDLTGFVLYSILLHRSLSVDLLKDILSMFSSEKLNAQLLRLEQFGILQYKEDQWQIDIVAYPAVRDFLSNRDFLMDAF